MEPLNYKSQLAASRQSCGNQKLHVPVAQYSCCSVLLRGYGMGVLCQNCTKLIANSAANTLMSSKTSPAASYIKFNVRRNF